MKKTTLSLLILGALAVAAPSVYLAGLRSVTVLRGDTPAAGELLEPLDTWFSERPETRRLDERGTLALPWGLSRRQRSFLFADNGRHWTMQLPARGRRVYHIVEGGIDLEDTFDIGFYSSTSRVEQRDL